MNKNAREKELLEEAYASLYERRNPDARNRRDATKIMAPEFMERDNIIAAFKHIGKGLGKGELHPGSWRETPGEVQVVPRHVRAYPAPEHPAPRYRL